MNRYATLASLFAAMVAVPACVATTGENADEHATDQTESLVAGSAAAGTIPAALPARMTVGLFESNGGTWMKSSGAKWDTRYAYMVEGWMNNWGWSANDGSYALNYMKECDAQGTMPVIEFYVMNGEAPAYDESAFYSKTTNASLMNEYWGEVRTMLQRMKDFGKPVVLLLEADGFAYMELQSGKNPNAYAAVAASGAPELAGLPNTVAGWGLGFLQMRKAVGANNVVMGPGVSEWANGTDLMGSPSTPLGGAVDEVYSFLSAMGVGPNMTGATYDFLVGDPADRDADYYRLVKNTNTWWDASDTASINSESFNRYAEWLRLWNVKSSKRWYLWQVPIGNSNSLDVAYTGQSRGGYKDNRTEYFFGPSRDAHLAKFADVGVIGLLLGAGAGDQSTYNNDLYTDGQLFVKSRAGAYVNAGGMAIARGGSSTTPDAGAPDARVPDAAPPPSDPSQYNFESSTQGWSLAGASVASVTSRASAGTHSLAVSIGGAAGQKMAFVKSPNVPAGKTVTFHVWIPAGSGITSVQPYVLQSGNWTWTGSWRATSSLTAGAWNTITVAVPAGAAALDSLGVQFTTGSAWTGTVNIDAVAW